MQVIIKGLNILYKSEIAEIIHLVGVLTFKPASLMEPFCRFLCSQLPEPIMPFRLYNKLMGLAKDSLHNEGDTPEGEDAESSSTNPAVSRGPELVDLGPNTDPDVLVLVDSLKEILKELPKPNIATLRYIIRHLRRSVIMQVLLIKIKLLLS